MAIAEEQTIYGNYVADGNPKELDLGFIPHEFSLINQTNLGSTANPGVVQEAIYRQGMADGYAIVIKNTNSAATLTSALATSGGFTVYDGSQPELEAEKTGTAITAASPAVVSLTSHGYAVGDVVQLYSTTGMLQVSGIQFVITAVGSANAFSLGSLDASGFAAAATAVKARRVKVPELYVPGVVVITNISAAANAVVTTSVNHGFAANMYVRLEVPPDSGMIQADGQLVRILSVTDYTFTCDLDTSGFTAFTWPTSAVAAAGVNRPQAVPVGEKGQNLADAVYNQAFQGIRLGTGVAGAASDVIRWRAQRGAAVMNE